VTLWAGLVSGLGAASCGGRTDLFIGEAPDRNHTPAEPTPEPPPTSNPPEPVPPCQAGMCPDDGDACNGVELCDPNTNTCFRTEAPVCDDGLVCNGIETCDATFGCVEGEAVVCDTPGASCDENSGRCVCEPPFLLPDCQVKTMLFAHLGTVRDLAEERDILWVTTSTGLWALGFAGTPAEPADDTWVHFDQFIGASDSGSIVVDQLGTKWIAGTYDRQLARLDDGGTPLLRDDDEWQRYLYSTSFSPNGLGVDASGNVWLGRYGETLAFSDRGTPEDRTDDLWRPVSELGAPESLVELSSVDVVLHEPPGVVWLGSSTGALFAYDEAEEHFAELSDSRWSRIDALAWEGETLWVSFRTGTQFDPALAAVPVRGSVSSVSTAESVIHAAPHAVETFDVDAGGHVWASDTIASFSCLDSADQSWSDWGLGAPVSTIVTRSPTELWFGAESVFHLGHGGSCAPRAEALVELKPQQALQSAARDVAIEGQGVWLATDRGVDYLDTAGTPLVREDDRWAHFDTQEIPGLEDLQGALVGTDGLKYFWGQQGVFVFDDGATPWDRSDDSWVLHDTALLWVSGVVDTEGRLLVVARTNDEPLGTARIVLFDPGGTPRDASDDVVTTIDSGQPGIGRNMTIDSRGEVWLATETEDSGGNLFHWDRQGTPLSGEDDVWTPMRAEDGRVWKLEADPTGGVWGTIAGGVFHFFDAGTPTDLSDDYWHVYPDLGSAMDIGPDGVGWFRMPGGAGTLDVGGTPREPSDDVARVLLSPDALKFQSDLWSNGTIDDEGRFWVVDEYVQVFEFVD